MIWVSIPNCSILQSPVASHYECKHNQGFENGLRYMTTCTAIISSVPKDVQVCVNEALTYTSEYSDI